MSNSFENASVLELVAALESAGRAPAMELMRAAMKRRHDLTPALLDMLATTPSETWEEDDPRWYAQIHAGHLLIFFREPQAIPIFMQLLRKPENEHLWDWFTAGLASYGLGILPELSDLLNDTQAPEAARIFATDSLEQLVAEFPTERGRVIEILKNALPRLNERGALEIPTPRPQKPNAVWSFAATSLAQLADYSSRAQIEALYRDRWMDESVMGDEAEYHDMLLHPRTLHSNAFNIVETYEALLNEETGESWNRSAMTALQKQLHELNATRTAEVYEEELFEGAPFIDAESTIPLTSAESEAKVKPVRAATPKGVIDELTPQQTIRRVEPKVGRNDPCPCGSGRKYKHCHGKS